SRREGEQWIAAGRVTVNGAVVTLPGTKVSHKDQVMVDGRAVVPPRESLVVLMLNKPPGVVCTRKDPEKRRSVFELLGQEHTRLISVGRLDYQSEGLILFTNNGNVAHQLMHPSNQVPRTYRVRVHGRIDPPMLAKLQGGVMLDDGPTGPLKLELDHVPGANSWLTITLTEGRNRMVRRIFETVEMTVSRLIRTHYGNATLGPLPRGEWRALQATEISRLLSPLKEATRLLELQHEVIPVVKPAAERIVPYRPRTTPNNSRPGSRTPRKPGSKRFGTDHGRTNKK
ncbi:MAG: rRNA pseudouridine synthase, partial [Magnetococcales bacterium]|nr:rRNA pseudouridine synthase [Magnetococcales bacterium]